MPLTSNFMHQEWCCPEWKPRWKPGPPLASPTYMMPHSCCSWNCHPWYMQPPLYGNLLIPFNRICSRACTSSSGVLLFGPDRQCMSVVIAVETPFYLYLYNCQWQACTLKDLVSSFCSILADCSADCWHKGLGFRLYRQAKQDASSNLSSSASPSTQLWLRKAHLTRPRPTPRWRLRTDLRLSSFRSHRSLTVGFRKKSVGCNKSFSRRGLQRQS